MEKITKFKAIDGSEFYEESKCRDYETLIAEVEQIMSAFPPLPQNDGCKFANGGGYIQHSKENFDSVKAALLDVAGRFCSHRWIEQTKADPSVHLSWAARLIGETGLRPLENAWNRLMCIDTLYREWGQPYFASNPEKAEQQVDIYKI